MNLFQAENKNPKGQIYGNEVLRIKSKKPDNIFDLRELFKFNLHFDSLIIFKLKNKNAKSHLWE